MKNLFISALSAAALFMVGCQDIEAFIPGSVSEASGPVVSFSLGFASSTEGSAELFDNESKFSNVTAAVFTKGGTFHGAFTLLPEAGRYSFDLEDGNWKLWVLANAQSAAELTQLLTVGTSREADLLRLTVAGTLAKDRRIPMISASAVEFYRDPEKSTLLGGVAMRRLAARIDVVNAVDELTIDRVVMYSRATAGTLEQGAVVENALEERAFNDLMLVGDSEEPTVFSGSLYTYDNLGTGADAPRVVVHYTYFGEHSSREFTFAQLTRNNLHSIQFVHRGTKLDYNAATWSTGERKLAEFSAYEIANRALLVYRFAKTNVQSYTKNETVVTFAASPTSLGLTRPWNGEGTIYTDAAGKKYRLPTRDEMRLIAPDVAYMLQVNEPNEILDQDEVLPNMFGIMGGAGTSDFWILNNGGAGNIGHTIYALRFKNTLQNAAYRYKFDSNSMLSVRIKAVDAMHPPGKDIICDEAYWSEPDEYIELLLPISNLSDTRYWTSSENEAIQGQGSLLILSDINIAVTGGEKIRSYYQRLINVD